MQQRVKLALPESTADVEHIARLALEFADKHGDGPTSDVHVLSMVDTCIKDGIVLFTDGGFIAGLCVPRIVGKGMALLEMGWYSNDGSGMQLLTAFEEEAAACNCTSVHMTTLGSNPGVGRVLSKRGYTTLQTTWAKTVGE